MNAALKDVDLDCDRDLWLRVCNEYLAMPGLGLTPAQASRLWSADLAASRQVLDALVDASFLYCRDGRYLLTEAGRSA